MYFSFYITISASIFNAATITAAPKMNKIAYSCFVIFLPFILLCNHNAIIMQSTQAKNSPYNRKIAFWHFASRQPRRDQSISRCNQNAIITRSIARRCCIASNFARRCSYSDKKDKFTARLNFACGKNASHNQNASGCNAAFFALRCGIDRAAMQQVTDVQRYFPV